MQKIRATPQILSLKPGKNSFNSSAQLSIFLYSLLNYFMDQAVPFPNIDYFALSPAADPVLNSTNSEITEGVPSPPSSPRNFTQKCGDSTVNHI